MIEIEAKKEIEHNVYHNTDGYEMKISKECYKTMINVLENQIPMKPIHSIYYPNGRKHHHIYCGKCGMYRQRVCIGDNYCRQCGTKIDWSE